MIEYKKVVVPTAISEEQLNVLGKEGWDNYAILGNAYFFKRYIILSENPIINDFGSITQTNKGNKKK